MSANGYVKAYRSRFDNPLLNRKPWCRLAAWDWLVSEAAWKAETLHIDGKPLNVERGEVTHSLRFMAGKWGWSVKAVRTFLAALEAHQMMQKVENDGPKAGQKQTHLKICNYDKYQDNGHSRGTAGAQQGHKDKEGKKVRSNRDTYVSLGDFDAFWAVVPRKVGKGAARKSYATALTKTDHQTLLSKMTAYADVRRGEDERYTVHPATWLNQERWADEGQEPDNFSEKLQETINAKLRTEGLGADGGGGQLPNGIQAPGTLEGSHAAIGQDQGDSRGGQRENVPGLEQGRISRPAGTDIQRDAVDAQISRVARTSRFR